MSQKLNLLIYYIHFSDCDDFGALMNSNAYNELICINLSNKLISLRKVNSMLTKMGVSFSEISHLTNLYTLKLVSDRSYIRDDELFMKINEVSKSYHECRNVKLNTCVDKVK